MAAGMAQAPVSYTHLDVYKRQVQERLARGGLAALPVEALPEPIPIVMVYRTPWHQNDIVERFHDAAHALLQAASSASADMPSGSSSASR